MQTGKRSQHTRQNGFTMLMVICSVALLAIASDRVMTRLHHDVQREREMALLRVGKAYAEAIRDYYEQSPGLVKNWPEKLEELVDDPRFITQKRHIRSLYRDPVNRSGDWVPILSEDGRIMGVHSANTEPPLQTTRIDLGIVHVGPANQYADWRFVYQPATGTAK